MSGLARTALSFNAVSVLSWVFAFAEQGDEAFFLALAVTFCALVVSSIAVSQKTQSQIAPRDHARRATEADELDAHTVLDLDARLEALERAQHDAIDAARWRSLVESGQVTAPAADPTAPLDSATGASIRNRQ